MADDIAQEEQQAQPAAPQEAQVGGGQRHLNGLLRAGTGVVCGPVGPGMRRAGPLLDHP